MRNITKEREGLGKLDESTHVSRLKRPGPHLPATIRLKDRLSTSSRSSTAGATRTLLPNASDEQIVEPERLSSLLFNP